MTSPHDHVGHSHGPTLGTDDRNAHSAHGHDHHHGDHDNHHGHVHGPTTGRAFLLAAGLNLAFVAAEVIAGLWTHSLALIADAGHNLSDVLSLILAGVAIRLSMRPPTARRTYGLGKGTILASLANAMLLLVAVGAMSWEAIRRFGSPQEIETGVAAGVAFVGILLNAGTAMLFFKGQNDDLNQKGAFLHLASDAAISAGVVVAALLIGVTGWLWLDPLMTLLIAAVILIGTWGLLRDSLDLALDATPRKIDADAVRSWLTQRPGVTNVHDLHIWAMSTSETALTAHLERPDNTAPDDFLNDTCEGLSRRFGIGHSTLQVESGQGGPCLASHN